MTNTYNRAALATAIYKEMGLSFSESTKLVDAIFKNMTEGIIKDGLVKIPLFGSFYLNSKNARVGRNPKTQEEVIIKPRNVISFYASKHLKKSINKK
jgi:integration host factor subunit alpha